MNPALRTAHARVTVALFLVGVVLMVGFDATAALAVGFACLAVSAVSGVALICRPPFLERDEDLGAR